MKSVIRYALVDTAPGGTGRTVLLTRKTLGEAWAEWDKAVARHPANEAHYVVATLRCVDNWKLRETFDIGGIE